MRGHTGKSVASSIGLPDPDQCSKIATEDMVVSWIFIADSLRYLT